MLQEANLNQRSWGEAFMTAIYLKNRSPTKAVSATTPEELWSGSKVDLSHLRVFGSIAYAHVPKEKRTKMDEKAKKMLFVGYCEASKCYRLCDPRYPAIIEKSRDVKFVELTGEVSFDPKVNSNYALLEECSFAKPSEKPDVSNELARETVIDNVSRSEGVSDYVIVDDLVSGSVVETKQSATTSSEGHSGSERTESENGQKTQLEVRSNYNLRSKGPVESASMHIFGAEPDPVSVDEAMKSKNSEHWRKAMCEEFNSLQENDTWVLVDRPADKNVVQAKWVFKLKNEPEGRRFKVTYTC